MTQVKFLIVNADDLGRSPGINRGIIEAHENGPVTSASLMVRWRAAADAAGLCRPHADLSLGLHVDLGEWECREGEWVPRYEVVRTDDSSAVKVEVSRQLELFRSLTGKNPTHLDSHQHVHLREPVRSVLTEAALKLGVPLRLCNPEVRYCGDLYGQTGEGFPLPDLITPGRLIEILAGLQGGITELACHPGKGKDFESSYRAERARELKTLCDPRIQAEIRRLDIKLCSFGKASRSRREASVGKNLQPKIQAARIK